MSAQANPSNDDLSLGYLVYLYLWPFWMFKDVQRGNALERAAAFRHNRERRIYLPAYLLKWSLLFVLSVAAISLVEQAGLQNLEWRTACLMLACSTGIFAACAFVVMTQITVAYLFLCRWEQ
ncbi:hypothetical protein [Chitinivorax sp. B]|uniref:hypothetical protein n=1 Tax=Chitinivorax sp. B TaxID=2502235 RepID=UPI0010FA1B5A|nr:hypothetical protein [Chitinivorax sp. B]